ncbi:hypothetical protein DL770_005642 [Monosporascus sp. CRB-9-2]|nr:hypothetical protein DL770_005642 [Monosporascus sp. CRB-9-2]
MKTSLSLLLAALARQTSCTGYPTLQWDPDTAQDCVEWYNNSENESCEAVRKYFGITPEEFHKWNPSVSLDCQPWQYQSYCILTLEKFNNTVTTTSSSTITTSTTSVVTPGPSPTSWTDMGCYVEDSKLPILQKNLSPAGGDAALSIPKCKNACYRRAYGFAGVQEGNQCWCGNYVGGEWASNQTDCNTPCTGDKKTFCVGKGLLNVFKAEENLTPASGTSTSTGAKISGIDAAAETITSETSNSGAMRNMAMF